MKWNSILQSSWNGTILKIQSCNFSLFFISRMSSGLIELQLPDLLLQIQMNKHFIPIWLRYQLLWWLYVSLAHIRLSIINYIKKWKDQHPFFCNGSWAREVFDPWASSISIQEALSKLLRETFCLSLSVNFFQVIWQEKTWQKCS